MLILAGLGNPEPKYEKNRHNVGFMAVDVVHTRWRFPPWRKNFQALVAEGTKLSELSLKVANESAAPIQAASRSPSRS